MLVAFDLLDTTTEAYYVLNSLGPGTIYITHQFGARIAITKPLLLSPAGRADPETGIFIIINYKSECWWFGGSIDQAKDENFGSLHPCLHCTSPG